MEKFLLPRKWKFIPGIHSREMDPESMTVPDQSFTIPDILEKFTRGIDPMVSKHGEGFEDSEIDFDDIPANFNPDMTDIDVMSENLKTVNKKIDTAKKKKEEEKKKKEADKPN